LGQLAPLPLHAESLSVLFLLCLLFYSLVLMALFSYLITMGAPLWLMGLYMLVMLINTFFEFGLEIIEESSKRKARPPALPLKFFDMFSGRGRFKRQLLMLMIFAGLAWRLATMGLAYPTLMVVCFVCLVFPASLAVNALYENLLEMINPVTLIGFMVITGKSYVVAVVSLALLVLALTLIFLLSWVLFLTLVPPGSL
jgi:hypothetical protein